MSKIYEALKKAEQERERSRTRVPQRPVSLLAPAETDGAVQEDYQRLRASLVSMAVPSGLHTILVTAPQHGEGTTTVAIGLATALAKERETRVLLVEGNVRTPCLSVLLPLSTTAGLTDYAAGRVAPEALATRIEDLNLSVIAAGNAPNPTLGLDVIDSLLARLQSQYDFIIIDAPPVNNYADTSVMATKVDGVILVVEADRTPVTEAEAAKRQLDKVGGRILGVVLNRRRSYIPTFLEAIL